MSEAQTNGTDQATTVPAGKTAEAAGPPGELTAESLKKRKKGELKKLCADAGLADDGTKGKLIERLLGARRGADGGFVGRKRKCRFCQAPARVCGSHLMDGGELREIYLKCDGPRRHSFAVYEPVSK